MNYWLVKTEPNECSIDDIANATQQTMRWDGVRNYQARNFLAAMALNDLVFIYHSSCAKVGIAGIAKVVRTHYPDPTQFEPESAYFDSKSKPDEPRWYAVDLQFVEKFSRVIPLQELKQNPALANNKLVQKGSRLSVMPFSQQEWTAVYE